MTPTEFHYAYAAQEIFSPPATQLGGNITEYFFFLSVYLTGSGTK